MEGLPGKGWCGAKPAWDVLAGRAGTGQQEPAALGGLGFSQGLDPSSFPAFSQLFHLLGITEGLLQIPAWSLLQPGGNFACWAWRWDPGLRVDVDPALELELCCIPGVGSIPLCALLNVFIIFDSHFPSWAVSWCLQPWGRMGIQPTALTPGDITQGWEKEDVSPCGNHRQF